MEFVKNFVLLGFKLKEDTWKKCLSVEEKRRVLEEFFDSEENSILYISVNAAGDLAPSTEHNSGSNGKTLYFKKKRKMKLTAENNRRSVLVGNLSVCLQHHVSVQSEVNCREKHRTEDVC